MLVVWALLAALWNFGGAWQLARGLPPPGPTASTLAGLILLAMAAGLAVAVRRWPKVFVLVTVAAGLGALVGGRCVHAGPRAVAVRVLALGRCAAQRHRGRGGCGRGACLCTPQGSPLTVPV